MKPELSFHHVSRLTFTPIAWFPAASDRQEFWHRTLTIHGDSDAKYSMRLFSDTADGLAAGEERTSADLLAAAKRALDRLGAAEWANYADAAVLLTSIIDECHPLLNAAIKKATE